MNSRTAKEGLAETFPAGMFTSKLPFYRVNLRFCYEKNHESKTEVKKTPKEEEDNAK
jgi:hypothetical protein